MLLLSKQWSRIDGAGVLLLVLLYYLNSIHAIGALSGRIYKTSDETKDEHVQEQPYRPQDEVQGEPSITKLEHSGPDVSAAVTTSPASSSTVAVQDELLVLTGTQPANSSPSLSTTATAPSSIPDLDDAGTPSSESQENPPRKAVVMGKLSSEDTAWVSELPDWESAIYIVDLPANVSSHSGHRTKINKSKEALPYLTYIVENYSNFPQTAVFVHAHRNGWPQAWHNDAKNYDAVNMINSLNIDYVQEQGYVNLRCKTDVGCPAEINLNREPPNPIKHAEHAYPEIYGAFFNLSVEDVKAQIPVVATPCCAQFAVSRNQVWKRSKEEYEKFLNLVLEMDYDDETLGTVMEYMWHMIFGREAVHCPDVGECYERVYGRTGMDVF
ncbi:hypothetical protein HII31_09648 [Pseudocercospora fuligena]|uniref:Uncharacterized protein n=1 Tax=Pseudocercospora fuligena TaxID=685502 RepID=A0A8H6VF26_9PEZI|nr:hypothetical protein HII31_09648 [Pseudocercospora fuligena]